MEWSKKWRTAGAVWILLTLACHGQYAVQTISLTRGWNAIYLQVQPDAAGCDTVFSNWPVASVSLYNMERTAVQFTENPDEPLDVSTEYLTWVPGHPAGAATLNSVIAGHAYLIFATNAFSQVVTGRPAVPRIEWIPGTNAVNLLGFSQNATATFGKYLAGAGFDAAKLSVYTIGGTNIASPSLFSVTGFGGLGTVPIVPGKAYCIACNKVSSFSGPVKVFPPGTGGISFPADSSSQSLRLKNENGAPLTVTLLATQSATAPLGAMPVLPKMYYFDYL